MQSAAARTSDTHTEALQEASVSTKGKMTPVLCLTQVTSSWWCITTCQGLLRAITRWVARPMCQGQRGLCVKTHICVQVCVPLPSFTRHCQQNAARLCHNHSRCDSHRPPCTKAAQWLVWHTLCPDTKLEHRAQCLVRFKLRCVCLQESGRAGRNGQPARSVLMYATRDRR